VYENDLLSMDELTRDLWGDATNVTRAATILLLRLAAAARLEPNVSPLIPHRLHFLVRAPQGLSVCLNTVCSGPPHLLAEGCGSLQAPRDRCVYCNAVTLPVHRCKACGHWAFAGHENSETGEMESGHFAEVAHRRYYLVADSGGKNLSAIVVNPQTGEYFGRGLGTRLFRAPCPKHGGSCNDTSQCNQQECPHCGIGWSVSTDDDEDDRDLKIQPLRGAERLAVGVAAETLWNARVPRRFTRVEAGERSSIAMLQRLPPGGSKTRPATYQPTRNMGDSIGYCQDSCHLRVALGLLS
jgi:hypothetical protein